MVNSSLHIPSIRERKKAAVEGGKYLVDWVEDELRQQMVKLSQSQNARLPREHVLAKSFDVSLNTVRSAMGRLKKDRLIHSVQGKGTFVVPSGKRTGPVLVVADNPYHPYKVMAGGVMSSVLREAGFPVDLYMGTDPEDELEYVSRQENLLGVILLGAPSYEFIRRILRQTSSPVVCIGDIDDEVVRRPAICDTVLQNFQPLAYTAVEYLIHAGHQRIAYCGWGLHYASGQEFLRGYRAALETHQIEFRGEWLVDFPKVPFGHVSDSELYHQPAENVQRQIDQWFEPGVEAPTALIHSAASELQIRDINHHYFRDHFPPEAIVGLSKPEYLKMNFNGMGKAAAVCMSFEHLARRALELLLRPREKDSPPVREAHEEICLYERENGVWKAMK